MQLISINLFVLRNLKYKKNDFTGRTGHHNDRHSHRNLRPHNSLPARKRSFGIRSCPTRRSCILHRQSLPVLPLLHKKLEKAKDEETLVRGQFGRQVCRVRIGIPLQIDQRFSSRTNGEQRLYRLNEFRFFHFSTLFIAFSRISQSTKS